MLSQPDLPHVGFTIIGQGPTTNVLRYPGQPRVPRALGGNYRQSLPKLFRRTKPSQGFIAETLRQANQLAWFC